MILSKRISAFGRTIVLATFALAGSLVMSPAMAAGGSSMGGATMPSTPQKSPQQLAVESYDAGLRLREQALVLTGELAVAESDKEKAKIERRIGKKYEQAARKFRSAIKQVPELYQAHGSLGYALKQLGEFDEAMAAYDEALRLRPQYTPAIEYRAEVYLALDRYDGVMAAHAELAKYDPGHRAQLETAVIQWLVLNTRDDANAKFFDWAKALSASSVQASQDATGS